MTKTFQAPWRQERSDPRQTFKNPRWLINCSKIRLSINSQNVSWKLPCGLIHHCHPWFLYILTEFWLPQKFSNLKSSILLLSTQSRNDCRIFIFYFHRFITVTFRTSVSLFSSAMTSKQQFLASDVWRMFLIYCLWHFFSYFSDRWIHYTRYNFLSILYGLSETSTAFPYHIIFSNI